MEGIDISRPSYFTRYSNVNDSLYNDRSYLITAIPQQLESFLWIVTSNDDKLLFKNDFLTFSINRHATVYIGYDEDAVNSNLLPSWLDNWENTGLIINSNDMDFVCFRKNFLPSTITLGANEGNSSSSMYLILIDPYTDISPPAAPTGFKISLK